MPSPTVDPLEVQPVRKRQRHNLLDVSNKPIMPSRTSGRIRVKMEAAAAAEQHKQQVQQQQQLEQATTEQSKTTVGPPTKPQVVIKHRRRRRQKMNGESLGEIQIDVKRPNSVLVDTSIRALLTNFAFSQLSPENQKILVESLPLVDRPVSANDNESIELNPSSINNEFFNRACIEWRDRLAYGEFTNEHQTKLKAEQERDKSKIDPWKARNFENIWGIKTINKENLGKMLEKSAMEVKGRMEQDDFEIPEGYINEMWKTEEEMKQDQQMQDENEQLDDSEQPEDMKDEEDEDDEDDDEDDEEDDNEMMDQDAEEEVETTNLNTVMMPSPSQNPSVSTSVPTPPQTVTSTQPDMNDTPPRDSPSPPPMQISTSIKSLEPPLHQPVIAEATSSADDIPTILEMDSPEPSTSNFIADDDDDIASHVELSSDGMPTQWYHQQEHDYLKNIPEMEPESSGMDMEGVGDIIDDTAGIELIENDNAIESVMNDNFSSSPSPEPEPEHMHEQPQQQQHIITTPTVTRITNYDSELPQEIFHKNESQQVNASSAFSPNSGVLINNYMKQAQEEQAPVVVVNDPSSQYNQVVMQDDHNEAQYTDTYMMDEAEIDSGNAFHEEIRMTMPKNVKLVAFPSGVNYIKNDNYIIEETPTQHIPQQTTSTPTYRTNGANIQPLQNSYFVGGGNTFTYISDMGNKIETSEPTTRIVKQDSNSGQGQQMKQRIIYEISTEPKVSYEQPTHHVTYATPPQPEIFHKMVNHNGTTTIYTESAGPPQKKTIIQRKKPNDPYTVQVALQSVTNNNTIILRPIGNSTTQQIQPQQQKSIVHIHRAPQIMQTTSQPVQFFTTAPPQTYLKKQTVIIPQMAPTSAIKTQPKYTTVIRAPVAPQVINAQQPQQQITTQQLAPGTNSKIQRPIQKQKVIMSTSSLQQYRSFNNKPNAHGSRKQLHPQHIIRHAPSTTVIPTTTVIHHSMATEAKGNQIPVILPSNGPETFTHQIPVSQVVSASPTVVTINSAPTKNIFVRQNRPPQQIFQPQHNQQIFTTTQPTQATVLQQQPPQQLHSPQLLSQQLQAQQLQTQQMQPQQMQPQQMQPQQLQPQNLNQLQNQFSQNQQISLHPRMRTLNHQRPPPGSVNLERSYQICQAVIQNSPNRHQLNCHLKPPPTSLLGGNAMQQKKF
ncbi:hypothetical protein ACKWTF_014127 [Chironomus riparius]